MQLSLFERPRPLILVTGGAGYIGQVLVRKLVDYGADVRVVDTFYFPPGMAASDRVQLIKGDVTNPSQSGSRALTECVTLQGSATTPLQTPTPRATEYVNTHGTYLVSRRAREAGVKRFTYASSASIYDTPGVTGTRLCVETDRVAPSATTRSPSTKARNSSPRHPPSSPLFSGRQRFLGSPHVCASTSSLTP